MQMENKVLNSDYFRCKLDFEIKEVSFSLGIKEGVYGSWWMRSVGLVGGLLAQLNISESAISFMKYSSAVLEGMYKCWMIYTLKENGNTTPSMSAPPQRKASFWYKTKAFH